VPQAKAFLLLLAELKPLFDFLLSELKKGRKAEDIKKTRKAVREALRDNNADAINKLWSDQR
jgi:hypothetical protein